MKLNEIAKHSPCAPSWNRAMTLLDKIEVDDTVISLLDVLEKMSVQDAIWCFRVNWFENRELYMTFVNNCVNRVTATDDAAKIVASYATYAANATPANTPVTSATYAANTAKAAATYAAATYAANYADKAKATNAATAHTNAERQLQYNDLKRLLQNHKE